MTNIYYIDIMNGGLHPILDDVGSFPLPDFSQEDTFKKNYWEAYKAILSGFDVTKHRGLSSFIVKPIEESMKRKIQSGMEIINYPQHMDMWEQFLKPIEDYETEPFLINPEKANVIEMKILSDFAKDYYEKTDVKLKLKACVTGPLELYLKKLGFSVYKDMGINLAKSVNSFMKKAIINEKYIETAIVSIDEPSIGLVTFNQITNDELTEILETSAAGLNADVQIHLHSLNAYQLALNTKSINILTCEYASNQKNVIPKKDLDDYDKFIRVGVSRTNLNGIMADEIEKGRDSREFETDEGLLSIIDSKEQIQKRYREAIERYGDRLKYVGPDCGLKSWGSQDVAYNHLKRTVEAVKEIRDN